MHLLSLITSQGAWASILELSVPLFFLKNHSLSLQGKSLAFQMDNTVEVNCIMKQVSARSRVLQSLSEEIFFLAESLNITIQAVYLPGTANVWADALSRGQSTMVEWALDRTVFHHSIEIPFAPPDRSFRIKPEPSASGVLGSVRKDECRRTRRVVGGLE